MEKKKSRVDLSPLACGGAALLLFLLAFAALVAVLIGG